MGYCKQPAHSCSAREPPGNQTFSRICESPFDPCSKIQPPVLSGEPPPQIFQSCLIIGPQRKSRLWVGQRRNRLEFIAIEVQQMLKKKESIRIHCRNRSAANVTAATVRSITLCLSRVFPRLPFPTLAQPSLFIQHQQSSYCHICLSHIFATYICHIYLSHIFVTYFPPSHLNHPSSSNTNNPYICHIIFHTSYHPFYHIFATPNITHICHPSYHCHSCVNIVSSLELPICNISLIAQTNLFTTLCNFFCKFVNLQFFANL